MIDAVDQVEEDVIKEGALFDLVKIKQINARTYRGVKFEMSRHDKWFHLLPIMLFISSSTSTGFDQTEKYILLVQLHGRFRGSYKTLGESDSSHIPSAV